MEKKNRYDALDGLRTYAILGIVLMHVLSNGGYQIDGFVFQKLIPACTNLVFLFMMVSGFGMCCGYFDKIVNQKISVEEFYSKRYLKIWPFFALICLLDFVMSPSLTALYEIFANLTLCFGLLPNAQITVIGVGWTLGVIFVFYMLFPFFCYLLNNKGRAWKVFGIALIFNILCEVYFFDSNHMLEGFSINSRTNIVYSAVYFIVGGLIFLYRDAVADFVKKYKLIIWFMCIGATVGYFVAGTCTITILLLSALLLIYALGVTKRGVLVNPFTKFISSISFEIYLCHMVFYRLLDKIHFNHIVKNDLVDYLLTTTGAVVATVIFSVCVKWILNKIHIIYIAKKHKN